MEIMASKETAYSLVNSYKDLIGQYMKADNGILVRIDKIEPAEWETGHWYDVMLVGHQKSETIPNTNDEIRVCLFDYLDEKGLLHDLPAGTIKAPDFNQKYFTTNMDLAFKVAEKFNFLVKYNRKFRVPNSISALDIDCIKVFLMPKMDQACYQVLICNNPLKSNTFLIKKDLKEIPSLDLLTYLQLKGYDYTKDRYLKDFIQLYL